MKQSGEIATPYGLTMTGQYGRSMVEMLGVLAVIGILSVAGIAGFKNAMDRNKANTIINEAQKRATLVVPQLQLQNSVNPTLTEFSNNNLGYGDFDTTVYTSSNSSMPQGQFGIKVENVSKEICQNILNTLGNNTVIRRLSTTDDPTTALTTCGETNNFLMVYNNDMTTNDKIEENKVEEPQACEIDDDCKTVCGKCDIQESEETGLCVGECESEKKECSANNECDGVCSGCDTETNTCQYMCKKVDYLESDGQSYIDTGYAWQTEYAHILYDWEFTKYVNGKNTVHSSINDTKWFGSYIDGNPMEFQFYIGSGFITSYSCPTNQKYTVEMESKSGSVYEVKFGSNTKTGTFRGSIISGGNVYIFSQSGISNPVSRSPDGARVYYLKMWDNGELKRDLVPILAPDKTERSTALVPGMFDKVNNEVYFNAGTGTFDYGPK